MKRERITAILVGSLFILGTLAGIASAIISGPLLNVEDYLAQVAGAPGALTLAGVCVLIMGFSLALIPVLMYPILRKRNPVLAMGYVVFRGALEMGMYILMVVCWLILVSVSRDFVTAGMPAGSWYHTLGTTLLDAGANLNHLNMLVFTLGALMYYAALYRSKLVPRWLSGWGFIGAALHLVEGLLGLLNMLPEGIVPFLTLPIAVQEMVYALWLIIKGFNKDAIE